MTSRRGNTTIICAMAALTLATTGCVSQRHADDLQTLYRRSQAQVVELRVQLEERDAQIAAMEEQLQSQGQEMLTELERARADRDRMIKELADAEERMRSFSTGPVLEPELDAALGRMVESNPDLMTYEPRMGMVKFSSDLTFSLGSTEVSSGAQSGLKKMAKILQSSAAKGYVACVVGHTDNVPIKRAETKSQHPTNWHLSVHRAIAVKDVLEKAGVPSNRLGVAGYGEHRPVATNTPKGNRSNRRVEVYLVRSSHEGAVAFGQPGVVMPRAAQDIVEDTPAPKKPATTTTKAPAPAPEPVKETPKPVAPEMMK